MPDDANPNADALAWYLSQVWPQIRTTLGGKAKLRVAGINASARVLDSDLDGVELLGYVDDLAPIYAASRVFVAYDHHITLALGLGVRGTRPHHERSSTSKRLALIASLHLQRLDHRIGPAAIRQGHAKVMCSSMFGIVHANADR